MKMTTVIISCPVKLANDSQTLASMPSLVRSTIELYEKGGRLSPNEWSEERKDKKTVEGNWWFNGTSVTITKRKSVLYLTIKELGL